MQFKTFIILMLCITGVTIGIGIYQELIKPQEYTAPVVETKEVVKPEDMLQSRIKEAQDAQKEAIEVEAQKFKEDKIKQANLEIELEVTTAYRKEIEAKEKELQAQSVAY